MSWAARILARLRARWPSLREIRYHLNPPLLTLLGRREKIAFGGWVHGPLRLLARLKWLRGRPWDPFGHTSLRREERELVGWYRDVVDRAIDRLHAGNVNAVATLLSLPDEIRGYGRIRHEHVVRVRRQAEEQLEILAAPAAVAVDAGVVASRSH